MASPPPTPSAQWWVWGGTGQISKGGVPGLQQRHPGALTDAAGTDVPKGTRLKNHTHHPLKKKHNKTPKSTGNNYKTPPPTFSFVRARNTSKLRGRQVTAALSFDAHIKLRTCSPTRVSPPGWGWGQVGPRGTSMPAESRFQLPRRDSPTGVAGRASLQAVSRPVQAQSCVQTMKSLMPGGCSELPP